MLPTIHVNTIRMGYKLNYLNIAKNKLNSNLFQITR